MTHSRYATLGFLFMFAVIVAGPLRGQNQTPPNDPPPPGLDGMWTGRLSNTYTADGSQIVGCTSLTLQILTTSEGLEGRYNETCSYTSAANGPIHFTTAFTEATFRLKRDGERLTGPSLNARQRQKVVGVDVVGGVYEGEWKDLGNLEFSGTLVSAQSLGYKITGPNYGRGANVEKQ
jgi:hypothetical protein